MTEFKINKCDVINVTSEENKEIIDYGVKMVGAPLEWHETMGEGIRVGIIDTGIDINHPELKNRIKDGADFYSKNTDNFQDENGHGTHLRCTGK